MQTLKELALLLARHRNRTKNHRNPKNEEMLDTFHGLIASGQLETNEEAAEYLFHAPSFNGAYRKLKEKMKQRLLDSVLLLDLHSTKNSPYDKAYIVCWKDWATAKILFNQRAVHTASGMAHRLLKDALYFEFSELSVSIARVVRAMYATRLPDLKKFERYHQLAEELSEQYSAETSAEGMYYMLVSYYIESKAGNPIVAEKATEYCQLLAPRIGKKSPFRLLKLYHQIRVISVFCNGDYEKTIAFCEEALSELAEKTFYTPDMGDFFYFHKIACYTQLNQYAKGCTLAEQMLSYEERGSFNWFKNRELLFRLALYATNYQEAYTVYRQVFEESSFRYLDAYSKELWKINEAFMVFLFEAGLFSPSDPSSLMSYRISKFLNEVPIFSNDKRGMNIPILIVHILFALARKRYDLASSRITAIDKYASRYVLKDEMERSNLFIRMLSSVDRSGYYRQGVIRKSKSWYDKLLQTTSSSPKYHIEVLPYERLWEITLGLLEPVPVPAKGKSLKKRQE